jgi:AbrB family looped-hinge helix DNA binding protein
MHTSTITSKGQVTIPAEMRKILGLAPGKQVAFQLEDGHITLEAVRDDVTAAFGMLKADRHVSIEEMDQAIAEGVTSRFETGVARSGK